MHRSNNASRGFLLVAAAAGLWVLGTGGVQADEPPSGRGTSGDITELTQVVERSLGKDATGGAVGTGTLTGDVDRVGEQTEDMTEGAGKAAAHVTEEAGQAVSTASSAAAREDLGAVPGIAAAATAPSAAGLPEDLVIEIPELVPGVPSIGILPMSLPALPVTPTIPAL
ncbi:hypothetical protein ACFPA8_00920 [Streptomyces ovatisporus]|uniref:Secreted protein n=1 Tax=Streptomyces ovatisporus TaxID=1128682 RepID=A0ABV8ZYD7_9ACTN